MAGVVGSLTLTKKLPVTPCTPAVSRSVGRDVRRDTIQSANRSPQIDAEFNFYRIWALVPPSKSLDLFVLINFAIGLTDNLGFGVRAMSKLMYSVHGLGLHHELNWTSDQSGRVVVHIAGPFLSSRG